MTATTVDQRRGRAWLAVIAGALVILAAIVANGWPTVFTDTDDYYALGQELVEAAVARVTPPPTEPPSAEEVADAAQAVIDAHMGHTQMASRSALYGVPLYLLDGIGTLWLVAGVQALVVNWLIYVLWRETLGRPALGGYLVGITALTLTSTLPFFVGFAMPDIFAGIGVLTATLLLVFRTTLGRGERWAIAGTLAFSLAVHTSHLLFVIPLALVGAALLARLGLARREIAARVGVIAAATAVAIVANSLYGISVRIETGDPLRNQPFLSARVLADGPGRRYLRHACTHGETYALCAFVGRRLDDSEDILWSDLPGRGVFLLSDYATRLRIEDEEPRFVLGTLAYDPLGQVRASFDNWWRQLGEIQVDDPVKNPVFYLTDPYWRATRLPIMILRIADCGPRGSTCPSRLTAEMSRQWHGTMLLAALVVAAGSGVMLHRRGPTLAERRIVAVVVLFGAAIVLNAAVCGMLSGPFARYQSRLVWLVPAAAGLLAVAAWRGRATARGQLVELLRA